MTTTSTLISLVTAVALGAGLAGCTSASSTSDPGPSPTMTSTTTAPPAGGPSIAGSDSTATEPADDTCVDGFAWMQFGDGEPRTKSLPDGCDTVIVNGSDAELTLGPTRVVVVMGDRNTVDVPRVDQVDAMGDDNTIRLDDDLQPLLNTDGTGNVVTTR
ncbi:DUF3060 domain-containing protein [Frigoribacterium sp. ME-P-080]|uniref:DUF3060 domain-containing protein n=1 Tax=Frigoribacterium sp. ME-P-080 TaxID=3040289 RepID=UPI0025514131|nr:DUF3060 domain-containing protein [Frigoribacterium sp. ME-P-080]